MVANRSGRPLVKHKLQRMTISEIMRNGRLIDNAMKKAAREAWLVHERASIPVPVWRNGRTIYIRPKDIRMADRKNADRRRSKPGTSARGRHGPRH